MNITEYISNISEKPLDNIVTNGGYCGIFRTIACIGDSLSSGEFESMINGVKAYHDYYDYSWGQYIARDAGCKVYNFSRGGMTAKEYCDSFAAENDFWNQEYRSQAYILALGVNDVASVTKGELELGDIGDIVIEDSSKNKKTFAGYYGKIVQEYKKIMPKAKFFLMTMPFGGKHDERDELNVRHTKLLYEMADLFENCYVVDLREYAPVYDEKFQKKFFLGGHLSAAGYRLTALMVESYIDYIIRTNFDDFKQIGFVGTEFYNESEKW